MERQIYTRTTNPLNQFARQEQCMSTTMVIDSRHSYRDRRSEEAGDRNEVVISGAWKAAQTLDALLRTEP